MRGYAVGSFGEAPEIDQLPAPAADDAVLIRVTFAGVNPGSAQDAALPAWRDKCKYSACLPVAAGPGLRRHRACGGVGPCYGNHRG
jgi:hypothetical protein